MTLPLSLLDLASVPQGGTLSQTFRDSIALARAAEAAGYARVWYAEHHNIASVASSATAVLMAQVAAHTSKIRIGAGGVMLPNHSPLVIAEQFGTLETLHPGRIDLGLGRAPGGDAAVIRALRRDPRASDRFAGDVEELLSLLAAPDPARPLPVRAIPGEGTEVPVWILGSSLFGAELAAKLGLPFAFASHFAPAALMQAAEIYRTQFRPSAHLDQPYFMMSCNVIAAETEAEAQLQATTLLQTFTGLLTNRLERTPPPRADFEVPPAIRHHLDAMLQCTAIGTAEQVAATLSEYRRVLRPDELMLSMPFHDPAARITSARLTVEARDLITADGSSADGPSAGRATA
ncbi:LLM class flavin-dependent oxidoreductase [Poseidonocella sedimentorum]|uniref:Luciferase-like monooxygenase n=1 Tax=Poseidonocella sedimentorum TaxID=871652 RepID=A0A1I6ERS2_9RHOB|nr:LLM class flavin-dependent oxidoreductase [Poseidonocella sedimentorum]SFR20464.1 luciferase family oxidoreductase, group 1 [Poseidonocella sedimentorum]